MARQSLLIIVRSTKASNPSFTLSQLSRVKPGYLELSEEFRLLFNMWEDRANRTFYTSDDAGNPVKAATITDNSVVVATGLIRRYQAVRQMHLALFLDSTLWSTTLPAGRHEWTQQDGGTNLAYYRDDSMGAGRFSRLVGKRVLAPPPISECGIWPYDKEPSYESFIIGVDDPVTRPPIRPTPIN